MNSSGSKGSFQKARIKTHVRLVVRGGVLGAVDVGVKAAAFDRELNPNGICFVKAEHLRTCNSLSDISLKLQFAIT